MGWTRLQLWRSWFKTDSQNIQKVVVYLDDQLTGILVELIELKNACFAEQDTVKFGQPHEWELRQGKRTNDNRFSPCRCKSFFWGIRCSMHEREDKIYRKLASPVIAFTCSSRFAPFFTHYEASILPSAVD